MKTKLIAAVLLLAMLLASFGCTSPEVDEEGSESTSVEESVSESVPDAGEEEPTESTVLDLGAVDEEGKPLYQIVYNPQKADSKNRLQEQCEALSADIADVTGVELPIVTSTLAARDNPYQILVGNCLLSTDVANTVQSGKYFFETGDFLIMTIGERLVIYSTSDYALASGVIYFTEQIAKKEALAKTYQVDKDYEFFYHPEENPEVSLEASEDGYFVNITLDNGHGMNTYARISYTGNNGWRVQTKYLEKDEFKDDGAAQVLAYTMGEYELGTEDDRFYKKKITTKTEGDVLTATSPDGDYVTVNKKNFRIDFYTKSGKLASSVTNITHNAGGSSISGALEKDEGIFGTGERMNGANQRGNEIEMFSADIWSQSHACYMVIPLLSSTRGSGMYFNIYEHMILDLGRTNSDTWTAFITGAGVDCYFYTTEQIEEVIHNYTRLTGNAGTPEEWTYGMLVCAYGPDLSQKWTDDVTPSEDGRGEGVYNMIANMEANDLPWTGVLAEGWGGYNASKHQDLKELCDYVHSLGKKFLVYMRVGGASASMEGFKSSYLLTQTLSNGNLNESLPDTTAGTNNPDVGTSTRGHVYLDFTNPDAATWFYDEYWDMLSNEIGVDGCKIDFCETLPENYELNYFDENIPTAGSHHFYPTAFCAMYFDMISSKPDSGMCYTRGGGIGSQRAPFMWAGDQERDWSGINYQLSAALSSGMSGVPFMSYDMSGYQYGSSPAGSSVGYEAEVFLRGTQFSAFTVCIQTHGKVLRSYQFTGLEAFKVGSDGKKILKIEDGKPVTEPRRDAEGNQLMVTVPKRDKDTGKIVRDKNGKIVFETIEAYDYVYETETRVEAGEYSFVTDIYRAYTKLHEHLTPYITELSEEACETGNPVMRHLVLGWQDDKTVYTINDQFMLGDAFLVAPVLTALGTVSDPNLNGVEKRDIYLPELPEGEYWIDLNAYNDPTKTEADWKLEGGQWLRDVKVSIAQMPTFYNTASDSAIAETLVDGIAEIYDYAESIEIPAAEAK